jgi:8-oxo-dGTP pyrophosphatase MutT (NUDIX family)
VGGAVEDGETLEAAAVRETGEETGFEIGDTRLPLFTRRFKGDDRRSSVVDNLPGGPGRHP